MRLWNRTLSTWRSGPKHVGSRQRGGVALEVALALPIFLFGILALMWIGWVLHANNALTTSLFKALRLSVTRSDEARIGTDSIVALNKWHRYQGLSAAEFEHLQELLKSPDIEWDNANAFHDTTSIATLSTKYGVSSLQELPPRFSYALAYFYQGMRQSVGPSMRYPCDPALPGNEGCTKCTFFTAESDPGLPRISVPGDLLRGADDIPLDGIGLECEFKPALFLVTPAMNALSTLLGRSEAPLVHLKSRLFFSAPL